MTPASLRKITVLELFEMAKSVYADYQDSYSRDVRAEFAGIAQEERDGVLRARGSWVREAMIKMALGAVGGDMSRDEIED